MTILNNLDDPIYQYFLEYSWAALKKIDNISDIICFATPKLNTKSVTYQNRSTQIWTLKFIIEQIGRPCAEFNYRYINKVLSFNIQWSFLFYMSIQYTPINLLWIQKHYSLPHLFLLRYFRGGGKLTQPNNSTLWHFSPSSASLIFVVIFHYHLHMVFISLNWLEISKSLFCIWPVLKSRKATDKQFDVTGAKKASFKVRILLWQ
jgi:hypothetical protein